MRTVAILRCTPELILDSLAIARDVVVVGARLNQQTGHLELLVSHPSLAEVPENEEPPVCNVSDLPRRGPTP